MSDGVSNFITDIIDADLASGKHATVVTRFPPEPNGYLHIGHAKSICLNFALAQKYGGRCHLRFDDTNPTTEDVEYVESIQRDVKWLGFDWGDHLYFASDYYERLYAHAVELIEQGKAYVCSLDDKQIREYRGTVTSPGRNSPYRDRSVAENLDLFRRMRAGEHDEGAHVVRVKGDMASPNMKMRDLPIYRIKKAHHYRTGDAWVIYPLYDFTHCLSDSYEGITHSICTLEFENNRELYDWVLANVDVPCRPQQIEFARLNLSYTMMSKRKLLQLVEEGHVTGWDDPRMPTLAGMRRRGVTPEALRAFCDMIGVAKANSTVDIGKLEYCIRDDLNSRAPRVMCVLRPLEVVLTNLPDNFATDFEAASFPPDVGASGSRQVTLTKRICIERDDFMQHPPKDFFRLKPGGSVRLRYAGIITCDRAIVENGEVLRLECSYADDPAAKVKGTIHWVSRDKAAKVTVQLYDRLFSVERPAEIVDLNPESLVTLEGCLLEWSAAGAAPGDRFQFERQGYFCADEKPGVFNRTVTLRDTWAKLQAREQQQQSPPPVGPAAKPKKSVARDKKPQEKTAPLSAAEQARCDALLGAGVAEADARRLAQLEAATALFHEARAVHDAPRTIANFIGNELFTALKEGTSRCSGAALGELCAILDRGEIGQSAAKQVLAKLVSDGGDARTTITSLGLSPLADLAPVIEGVMAAHPDEVARFREGKTTLMGFFVGQVMRASKGRADPKDAERQLRAKLA